MYTPPSTWPRASTGLITRPMSCPIQTLGTRIQPVAASTSTSTTAAVYEYATEGPTPPPRYRAALRAGRYEPVVPSVPCSTSAATTASWKVRPADGFSTSNTRRSAKASRSAGNPSFFAAAAPRMALARSAA